MNARHDALIALTASVPWPLPLHHIAPHDAPPAPPGPPPVPKTEPAIEDPPAPDQLPPVQDPPASPAG